MTSRRTQKAAEAIREVVSMAILTEMKDPRVRDVTVTQVEVTPDMRQAKVHVSIMGNDTRQQLGLRGLQNAAGFLQSKVGKRIDTRYTPRLEFVLDLGIKKSIEIARILQSVLPPADRSATTLDETGGTSAEAGDDQEGDENDLADEAADASDRPARHSDDEHLPGPD